jgi:hypothetical protein
VIKFVRLSLVSSTIKTDCHNITEILLKVSFNTITPNPQLVEGGQYLVEVEEELLACKQQNNNELN